MATGKNATKTTYILILFLRRAKRIKVGALGFRRFEAGMYFYVGSGGRSPVRRIARHARPRKRKHWHIDFLSAHAIVIGAVVFEASKSLECAVAAALSDTFTPIPGFGCSDCACTSHLFRVRTQLNLETRQTRRE